MAFLAPAITVDGFRERLEALLGSKIDRTTIFTMAQDWERTDNCVFVYRKSLLYLIHYALEHHRDTDPGIGGLAARRPAAAERVRGRASARRRTRKPLLANLVIVKRTLLAPGRA